MIKPVVIILISLLVAMILMIMPLPEWAIWWRPQWVLMVLIFWILATPNLVGLFSAFFVGLFVDLLTASSFGEHALIYTVVCYFVAKYATRIQVYMLFQKTLVVFLLIFLAQLMEYWLQGLFGLHVSDWGYWLSSISSAVLWPWVYLLLKDTQRRFRIRSDR